MTLDPTEVLRMAADGVWLPPYARTAEEDGYLVIAYPEHFSDPTVACRLHSDGPADALVDRVLDAARGLGRDAVTFSGLNDATRPPDLEPRLVERGATLVEELAVLAIDLAEPLPDLGVPEDVVVEPVTDLDGARIAERIGVAVFGGSEPDEEALAASYAARLDTEQQVLALLDGEPVGTAGLAQEDGRVRLWGACVLPQAQHRGVYRALLDRRLRDSVASGHRVALVKGRVATSAPVLLRCGFRGYGEERSYRLAAS